MKVIPIVIGTLGTIRKRLVKGMEGLEIRRQVEIMQTTGLLRSAKILRKSWRLEETPLKNHTLKLERKTFKGLD